ADPRYPGRDPRYQHLTDRELPLTENLSETLARVLPFWTETVMPALRQQQKVIVCAHGNSLRALVQYIDKLTDEQITQLDIVTGVPMVYQLNDNLERVNHYLLTE
ncbi:MAG: 2,3-bisphosphoglycerate-dependent phosphoglycerate mutase, partial [Hymenobacter sp.]